MLLLWKDGIPYWKVFLGYALLGIGVGLAGTPASHSLTGSVPVKRAGMASGTADLQRDLGGAIMQSILGALLTAGYASAFASAIAGSPNAAQVSDQRRRPSWTKSFASAADTAAAVPAVLDAIIAAAKSSFVSTATEWAFIAGHHRGAARRGARLLPLPEARRGASAARAVPRGGHRARRGAPPA